MAETKPTETAQPTTISETYKFRKPSIYEEYDVEERLKNIEENMKKMVVYLQKIFASQAVTAKVCPNCGEPEFVVTKRKCSVCKFEGTQPNQRRY